MTKIDLNQLRERATNRIFGLPEAHQMLMVDRHDLLALITTAEAALMVEEAVTIDRKMGYPLPGESAVAIFLHKLTESLARFTTGEQP